MSLPLPEHELAFDDEGPPPPPLAWRPGFRIGVDLTNEEALLRELLAVKLALTKVFGTRVLRIEAFATADALMRRYLERYELLMARNTLASQGSRHGPHATKRAAAKRDDRMAG
jgi:hypothetical protein